MEVGDVHESEEDVLKNLVGTFNEGVEMDGRGRTKDVCRGGDDTVAEQRVGFLGVLGRNGV